VTSFGGRRHESGAFLSGRREAGGRAGGAFGDAFRARTINQEGAIMKAIDEESMQLAVQVCEKMQTSRNFALRDQMQRAAVSVPSNIAEGYERNSNREFVQFLGYSRGSNGELRTQIYLAGKFTCIDRQTMKEMLERSRRVSAMLHRYIQVRKSDF
jgi:four helix bundle protein